MTIGIGLYGPNAGAAGLLALRTAEKICSGAIGGFVAAAALTEDSVMRVETQTGGVENLQYDTSKAGFSRAEIAGFITSGPNRPAPLSAFVAAAPGVGVVTGHRMPNTKDSNGNAMNQLALQHMAKGTTPQSAVETVLNANPEADCGLIAVTHHRTGYAANTLAVKRADAGLASANQAHAGIWILHNAVKPFKTLAPLLVEVALDAMNPVGEKTVEIQFNQGCTINQGDTPQIHVDEHYVVTRVIAVLPAIRENLYPLDIGYHPPIIQRGKQVGFLLYEPLLTITNNQLVEADGMTTLMVSASIRPF